MPAGQDMVESAAIHHRIIAVDHDLRTRQHIALAGDGVLHHLMLATRLTRLDELADKAGFTQRNGLQLVPRLDAALIVHQREPCRGAGTRGAPADYPRMNIGRRTRAIEVVSDLLHRSHEV